jgi:hypothetical protein
MASSKSETLYLVAKLLKDCDGFSETAAAFERELVSMSESTTTFHSDSLFLIDFQKY